MKEIITPAEFSAALIDAEYSRAVTWWSEHGERHGCDGKACDVRMCITRSVAELQKLKEQLRDLGAPGRAGNEHG